MTHTIRPLYGLYPNYGTPVQVVVNERTGLDFFFRSSVVRLAGRVPIPHKSGRLAIHTAHLMDLFYINLFCSDMKRSVVLISIVRVPTYEYQLRPLPLSRLVSLLGAGSTSTKFS